MSKRRIGKAKWLESVRCDPEVAEKLIIRTRRMYTAVAGLRDAGLPKEGHAMVSEIEANVIRYGQWLRDNGLGKVVDGEKS